MQLKTLVSITALLSGLANAQPFPFPNAFPGAKAMALADVEATYECHASCGYLILAARACTPSGDSDSGPWDETCMCTSGSQFMQLVDSCLECGWCLWSDYGPYLTAPLDVCSESVTPTGTTCEEVATSYLATADLSDISFATTKLPTSDYNIAASSGAAYASASASSSVASSTISRAPSTRTSTAGSSGVSTAEDSDEATTTGSSSSSSSSSASASFESASSSSTGAANHLVFGAGSAIIAAVALLI